MQLENINWFFIRLKTCLWDNYADIDKRTQHWKDAEKLGNNTVADACERSSWRVGYHFISFKF